MAYSCCVSQVKELKNNIQERYPNTRSSHLLEAIAFASGFNTWAALKVAHEGLSSDESVLNLCDEKFKSRLLQLDSACTGFQNFSLSYAAYPLSAINRAEERYTSTRSKAWRNLMVAGINVALDEGAFQLSPPLNFWPGHADRGPRTEYKIHFQFNSLPAVVTVDDAGWDEIKICVGINPKQGRSIRVLGAGIERADAIASGWLERRNGLWLQKGSNSSLSCRRHLVEQIAAYHVEAKGYLPGGKFMM